MIASNDNLTENSNLAIRFESNVSKIFYCGKYILGISEDNTSALYDSDTEKVI